MKLKFTLLGMLLGISVSSQITLSKDLSFGNNGFATFRYPSEMAAVNFEKVFINADNSLNICLGTDGTYHTGMIAQLTPHGVLDLHYNNTGKIVLSANQSTAFEFAKQGDKIVAVYANDSSADNPDTKMVRYNPDGKIDRTFGTEGTLGARPDLFYKQLIFQPNAFYHIWGKVTGYLANGALNNSYGVNGNQDPVVNGIPQEYMELYSFFGSGKGKNYLHKYHYDIAVSEENSPHQFKRYDLTTNHFYDVPGAASGVSVYPKKFELTAENKIAYLFGIDPNSGNERNRFVVLNELMKPQIFAGKEFIDLGEVSSKTEIFDLAPYQNQYIFVGKKDNRPVIFSYDKSGNKTLINGADEWYESLAADSFSKVVVKGNAVYVFGKKTFSHDAYVIKYNAQILDTEHPGTEKITVVNPFRNELKILNSKNFQLVSIYNTSGQLLISDNKSSIATAHLPRGLYLVKIDLQNQQSKTFKVIKN